MVWFQGAFFIIRYGNLYNDDAIFILFIHELTYHSTSEYWYNGTKNDMSKISQIKEMICSCEKEQRF